MKDVTTTLFVQAGNRRDTETGSISFPVYQTASFGHPALGQSTGFDYSRTSNPTRLALEETMARADGGSRGFAFASGMAALHASLQLLQSGDRIVVTEDLYGGSYRLLERVFRPLGIDALYVDTSDLRAVEVALKAARVKAIFVENPTNPILKVADLRGIAAAARPLGVLTIVDNTFLTPVFQRPLSMGADIVVYSATKYLAGHNDVVAGIAVARTPELADRLAFYQNAIGGVLGPQDAWLTLRGLKTLPLRIRQQQANATHIAEWLRMHPHVRRVYYPGLSGDPGRTILDREHCGYGGMISFEVDSPDRVPALLARVKVFTFAESLGGVESLVTYPAAQTHADMDPALRERLGINARLIRLSVGIENVEDLLADVQEAL